MTTKAKKRPAPAPAPVAAPVASATYTRTAKDLAAVSVFLDSARTYDKQTHAFAMACAAMYAQDLHNREGVENFGAWCSLEFKKAGIGLEGRNAYRLAQVGALLHEFKNAPELVALPSRALTGLIQKREELERIGSPVEIAARLPEFMKEQKIGNALDAIQTMANWGEEGDPRTPEERKADEKNERRAALVLQVANIVRTEADAKAFGVAVWNEVKRRGLKKAGTNRDE